MSVRIPVIAIVGRPNVGKSTLFNRIVGERRAIVEDFPGVTRDRNYAMVERFAVPFLLVDTGGFEENPEDVLAREVVKQTMLAAEEADVVLAVFDGSLGLQPGDEAVVDMLRRYQKPVFFLVNKIDGEEQLANTAEFYSLGVDELLNCSALHGRNVRGLIESVLEQQPAYAQLLASVKERKRKEAEAEDLASRVKEASLEEEEIADPLDSVQTEEEFDVEEEEDIRVPRFASVFIPSDTQDGGDAEGLSQYLRSEKVLSLEESSPRYLEPKEVDLELLGLEQETEEEKIPEIPLIKVAIVGRPNVGKSTLLNTFLGEQRAITSSIAGTTRDALSADLKREGQNFQIVDTAGLRKQARIEDESLERYSALRSIGALSEADVAVLVLDAESGPSEQDAKILGLIHERGIGAVVAVNKWDLVEKDHKTVHEFTTKVKDVFKFAPYAPIVYISALSGRRCPRVLDAVKHVAGERLKRIPTARLNQILQGALRRYAPSPYRGREIKLYYAVQVDVGPPRFALFFNYPKALHFSFLRFLKNSLRDQFKFEGTDIKLSLRKR